MKPFIKNLTALCIGAFSLLIVTSTNAQIRPRISIGFGYGGFYPRSYYYNPYGGYYGYAYPRIGLSFGVLPYGYMPFYFGSDLYYLNNGIYYRQYDNNYRVVAPPVGAEVPQLPARAHSLLINNQQYFELSGVYYKPNLKADGTTDYLIAGKDGVLSTNVVPTPPAPPAAPQAPQAQQQYQLPPTPPADAPAANAPQVKTGDIVGQLPDGCKAVNVAGKKYFVTADDIYYQEFNDGGKVSYRVAGTPADQNTKQ